MPIKISELNPLNPALSAFTAVGEEGISIVKGIWNPADSSQVDSMERGLLLLASAITVAVSAITVTVEVLYDSVIYLVKYVWDTVLWLAQQNPSNNNLSPQAVSAARFYAVNRSRISELPQDATLDSATLAATEGVLLDDLTTEYDRLVLQGAQAERDDPIRNNLENFARFVRNGKAQVEQQEAQRAESIAEGLGDPGAPREKAYFENMERTLLNTIFELRTARPDNKKACDALNGIAEAYHGCDPRKYKESKRHLERMMARAGNNATERLDQQLLLWLKGFKEDIVLNRYQSGQFHILNKACQQVRDWGLGGDNVELNDPYINMGGFAFALNFRYTLNKEYTPARIIEVVKTNLDDVDYNDLITPYFEEHADTLPDDYEHTHFDRHGKLNHKGVAWLLWHRGFFSQRIPVM